MSSTDSPHPDAVAPSVLPPYRSGFDAAAQGLRAVCDGGRLLAGTHLAGRQEFCGRLTGDIREFGPERWRWYLMTELTRQPFGYAFEAVWCDESSLTYLEESA